MTQTNLTRPQGLSRIDPALRNAAAGLDVVEFLTDNSLGRLWYEMTKGRTQLAQRCRYLIRRPNEVFLGKSVTQTKNVSDETAHTIDEEVRKIIEANYSRAKNIIVDNLDKLHAMAAALIKYETIDSEQIRRIFAGQDPGPPESWNDSSRPSGGGGPTAPQPVGGLAPRASTAPKPASQQT